MDYEKLHKDTINKLQQMVNSGQITIEIARSICTDFVPENENERIRKAIEYAIGRTTHPDGTLINGVSREEAIAWLEKRGKILRQRADVIISNMLDDKIDGIQRELIEFAANAIEAPWLEIIKSADYYAQRVRNIIDEQDEQKSADKIEPKFHEGEWITIKQ